MDFKSILNLAIYNPESPKSYVYLETIILKLLEKEAHKQGKKLLSNYKLKEEHSYVLEFDAVAPNGLFDIKEPIAFEFRMYTRKESLQVNMRLNRVVTKYLFADNTFTTLIFIITLDISDEEKKKIISGFPASNKSIQIWDLKKINQLVEDNKEYFDEISKNIFELTLNRNIENSLKSNKNEWKEIRNKYICELSDCFKDDDLVLMLGAGVSRDAGIPTWDNLVSELLVSLIQVKLEENRISIGGADRKLIMESLKDENANSPLLQTRYIRTGLKDDFFKVLSKVLYKSCSDTSDLLKAIAKLSQPLRNKIGVKAIINYNFDDLIEKNLDGFDTKYKSIFRESDVSTNDSLSIFHVHGFLPRQGIDNEGMKESLMVFSEEGYHKVMLDPYHWSNLVQLNYLRENTCLLIGLSMTDPNLRRLLDIAMRKRSNNDCKHYVILKREDLSTRASKGNSKESESLQKFNSVNYALQEDVLRELGLKIVWVEEFTEIPAILKRIRKTDV